MTEYIVYQNEDGKCIHPANDPGTKDCGEEIERYQGLCDCACHLGEDGARLPPGEDIQMDCCRA